ncbi:MAG: hypothetical protein MZU84_00930 [Sphingobacterium sp.]|nr:hypothetical protein [Sphingobacterium sp.]
MIRLKCRLIMKRNSPDILHAPQPTILDINLKVDLFPKERTVNVDGKYLLLNHHNQPIKEIYVNLNDWNLSNLKPLKLSRSFNEKLHAEEFGFRIFELEKAMQQGDTMTLHFDYDIIARGFTENQPKNEIAENGSCLMLSSFSSMYFPLIGYNLNAELMEDKDRKEFDLPAKADAPKLKDADRSKPYMEICRPNYEAIISTSSDQTIISGGRSDP